MENSIDEITILPYSETLYRYSINNSEKLHATNREKLNQILNENCPNVVCQLQFFLDRKIPVYINVVENKAYELYTKKENLEGIKIEKFLKHLNNPIVNNTKKLEKSHYNFWKRGIK